MTYRDLEVSGKSSYGEDLMETVKTVLKTWWKIEVLRRALFVVMVLVGVLLTFCEPSENSLHWCRDLMLTKGGALLSWYAVRRIGRGKEL
ncbi:MAG: hypothetical protein HDR80_02380 [Bacteroides sp.]|nr:hypothetical protein [Bacteroides sp.]